MHLASKAWILFAVNKQRICFTAVEEDGGDKRLVELAKLMALHRQILFSLTITAIVEAIPMRTSAEQVLFLYRLLPGT